MIYVNPRRHKVPHFGADTPLSTGECPSPANAILNERRGDFRGFHKKKSGSGLFRRKKGDKRKDIALGVYVCGKACPMHIYLKGLTKDVGKDVRITRNWRIKGTFYTDLYTGYNNSI